MNTIEKAILASLIVLFLTFIALLGYSRYLQSIINELLDKQKESQERYLQTLQEFIKNYNELQQEYDKLYLKYHKLLNQENFYNDWEVFTVTAYTSLDKGCNSYSSTGMNIEKLSQYFNFCAVDPQVIPYGSVVLVRINGNITPFLAVDTGGAISGKHIDLYFVNDKNEAFLFGKKELEVKILK